MAYKCELIDTLWNVNVIQRLLIYSCHRINRYIMECKLIKGLSTLNFIYELIDTLWNVNSINITNVNISPFELIDTLWNVNFCVASSTSSAQEELIDTLWNVNL